jgi:hypothetical protein
MMDWFPAVMALVGVLVGVGVQEFRIWREKKDKYKDMVFEKLLEAHQDAYYWCMRLSGHMRPDRLMRDGGVEAAIKEDQEALEWLNKNALYLDEDSRTKMTSFILYIHETSMKYKDEKWKKNINIEEELLKTLENVVKVTSSLKKGIGVKYLPEQEISIENIEMERAFDTVVKDAKGFREKQKK